MKQSARIPWTTVCLRLLGCAMIGFGTFFFVMGALTHADVKVCSAGLLLAGAGALIVWSTPRIASETAAEPRNPTSD